MSDNIQERRSGWSIRAQFVLLCICLVVVSVLSVSWWYVSSFNRALVAQKSHELESETRLQGLRFLARIEELKEDTLFLTRTPPIQGIFRARKFGDIDPVENTTEDVWKNRLQRIFMSLALSKGRYFQVRLIGIEDGGREIVRIDRDGLSGKLRVCPENELAKKGDRDYVLEAAKLLPEGVAISRIELNREHGKISQPETPVIRASVPVYFEGKVVAVLVINQDVTKVFEELSLGKSVTQHYFITNGDGDYLLHPDAEEAFAFEHGRSSRLQDEYPEFAEMFDPTTALQSKVATDGTNGTSSLVSLRLQKYGPKESEHTLGLAVAEDLSDVLAVSSEVQKAAYIMVVGLTIVSAVIGAAFIRGITSPLVSMSNILSTFDGSRRIKLPVESTGEAGQLARIVSRMLERIQRQTQDLKLEAEERREAEASIRAVLEATAEGIVVIDERGIVLSFNPGAEKIFNFNSSEMLGENVKKLMADDTAEVHDQYLANYRSGKGGKSLGKTLELLARKADGTVFPIELTLDKIELERGTKFVGVIRDVTDRKSAEEQLKNLNDSLSRSNSELEQFAHAASHDLQSPLRSISNFVQLIEMEAGEHLDDEVKEYIQFISSAASRMRNLVQDLLRYSKVDSVDEPIPVKLSNTLDNVAKNLQALVEETGTRLVWDDLPAVLGHPTLLIQLFQNLVENAIKYRGPEVPCVVTLTAEQRDDGWLIQVIDNGPGIPPKYREKVFQMFQRLPNAKSKEGTGLGLALCQKIVGRLGGEMWLAHTDGPGCTFCVLLRDIPNPD